jgi:hypothetical protein
MSNKKNTQKKKHTEHHKQPAHAKHEPKQKVRGGWLTAAIVVVILHGLMMLGIIYGNDYLQETPAKLPSWFIPSVVGVAIADIVAGIALWRWKGWGFYLYLVATIVIIALGILATGYAMLWSFSRLIPIVIVGYIMRPKWQYFD